MSADGDINFKPGVQMVAQNLFNGTFSAQNLCGVVRNAH